MSTIILNREAAKLLVDVALSAASRDYITPVICGAHVSVEDGKLRVTATDRYRVHTALIRLQSFDGEVAAIIPRAALEWLAKNRTYFGGGRRDLQRVRIEMAAHGEATAINLQKPGALTITVTDSDKDDAASVTWNGRHTLGKFPPVIKLIETARAAEPMKATPLLRLDYVGSINRLVPSHGLPVRVKFTESGTPNKPGPVYFSVEDHAGQIVAEALLQPHLEREARR